jgi:hypothetical protein
MKKSLLVNITLILIVLTVGWTATAPPALAAPTITSVMPGVIASGSSATLSIIGADFVDGAVASLEGFGNLSTSFVSSTSLVAQLPGNVPVGTYTLRVTNPDSTWGSLFDAIRIVAVAPTAAPSPAPTEAPAVTERPVIVVDSYEYGKGAITPGQSFDLQIKFANRGQTPARNIVILFPSGDFVPEETGGVQAIQEINPGERKKITQQLLASTALFGQQVATLEVRASYYDEGGNSYSETFTIAIDLPRFGGGPAPTTTPTPTLAPKPRPQLVVTQYSTDISPLQPGSLFNLQLVVQNLGDAGARRITMIVGGGTASVDPNGTPVPGGGSGSGADLTNFAPVGTSNIQYLGDLPEEGSLSAQQSLIVNVSINPGAYPLKLSFTYTDEKSSVYIDDQVITLLVYTVPQLDVNFYRDPGPIFAGQPNQLPLQVVNLGRKLAVLGNMTVTTQDGQLSNNTILVGSLDLGGYFTLDATLIPNVPGPLNLVVTIDYTDDFNKPQQVVRTIPVEILEAQIIEPPIDGGEIPPGGSEGPIPAPETFLQRAWRFLRGLLGLDSAPPTLDSIPGELPPGEAPPAGSPVLPGPKG